MGCYHDGIHCQLGNVVGSGNAAPVGYSVLKPDEIAVMSRQRKAWAASTLLGGLKLETNVPCGFRYFYTADA